MVNEQIKRGALGLAAAVAVGVLSFWLAWKLSVQEPEGPRVASEQGKHPVQREPVAVPLAAVRPAGEKLSVAPSAAVLPNAGEPSRVRVDLPTATITIQTKRLVADQAAVVDPVGQVASQNTVKKEALPAATALIPAEVSRSPASASAPLALDPSGSRAAGLPTALASERSHSKESSPELAIISAKAPLKIAGGSALAMVPVGEASPSEIDTPQAAVPPPALAAAVVPGRVGVAGDVRLATTSAQRLEGAQARLAVGSSRDQAALAADSDALSAAQVGPTGAGRGASMAAVAAPDVKSVPASPGTAIFEQPGAGTRGFARMTSAELPEPSRASSGLDASLAAVAEGAGGRPFYTADLSPEAHMADSQLQAASVGVRASAKPQTAASVASISPSVASAVPLTTAAVNRGTTSPVETGRVETPSGWAIDLALVPPELPSMCLRSLSLAPLAHSWLPVYADAPRSLLPGAQPTEVTTEDNVLPADPLIIIESCCTNDTSLITWIANWRRNVILGDQVPGIDRVNGLSSLRTILATTSLSFMQLYLIGHSIGWVEGETVAIRCSSFSWADGEKATAAPFYRAAVSKAEIALRSEVPGGPTARPYLVILSQMSGFWDLGDFDTMSRVYHLIGTYSKIDSSVALATKFLEAEALYQLGRGADKTPNRRAADVCRQLIERPEFLEWPIDAQASVHYLRACALFQGGDFLKSISDFKAAAGRGSLYKARAGQWCVLALARAGRMPEAQVEYDLWTATAPPNELIEQLDARLKDIQHAY